MAKIIKKLNTEYKIRQIQQEDNMIMAEIIRYNLKNNGLDIPGTAYYDKQLDSLYEYYLPGGKKGYYVLTDSKNNVVGGIGFEEFLHIDDCAELQKLYLADSVKGYGLGYVLIQYVEKKMAEASFKRSYLETHENLKSAIYIYEKCGYIKINRPEKTGHGAMTHFYMKNLSD